MGVKKGNGIISKNDVYGYEVWVFLFVGSEILVVWFIFIIFIKYVDIFIFGVGVFV